MDQELLNEFQTLMDNAKAFEDLYELLEVIDTTKHSTIYKAQTKEGAFRIVKKVNPSRENTNREFDVLRSVHHEAIPQVYEIYHTVEGTYIIMEWIEGVTLSEYVLRKERNKGDAHQRSVMDRVIHSKTRLPNASTRPPCSVPHVPSH